MKSSLRSSSLPNLPKPRSYINQHITYIVGSDKVIDMRMDSLTHFPEPQSRNPGYDNHRWSSNVYKGEEAVQIYANKLDDIVNECDTWKKKPGITISVQYVKVRRAIMKCRESIASYRNEYIKYWENLEDPTHNRYSGLEPIRTYGKSLEKLSKKLNPAFASLEVLRAYALQSFLEVLEAREELRVFMRQASEKCKQIVDSRLSRPTTRRVHTEHPLGPQLYKKGYLPPIKE